MYTQIFLVTSVRGIDFPPQTAANAGLRVFGAEKPNAFFLHRGRHLLARRLRRCLTKRFLRRLKRFSRRLSNGRLLRLGRRDLRLLRRRLRHIDQADDTARKR